MDEKQAPNFFNDVPLETIVLGALNTLYIYDRSMIMGQIPFWRIFFNEEKVLMTHNNIFFRNNFLLKVSLLKETNHG